jgi:ATP-dependent RNA helicase RhlE
LAQEHDKAAMLAQFIKNSQKRQSVVVTRSKRRADELSVYLQTQDIKAVSIHGNTKAGEYEATAKAFKSGELNTIITTDMILQLLELSNIETIINYDIPTQHEDYFNRLMLVDGKGESISFVSPEEKGLFSIIEMRMKLDIPQEEVENFVPTLQTAADEAVNSSKDKKKKPRHRTQLAKKVSKKKEKKDDKTYSV